MSDSVYQALFTAVYVIIFVIATTITLNLFNSANSYAESAYEYGKLTSDDSVIEVESISDNSNVISGTEMFTYYYNYVSNDKYGENEAKSDYKFEGAINGIKFDKDYELVYKSKVSDTNEVVIDVKETNETSTDVDGDGDVENSNKPTIPDIKAYRYDIENNLPANTEITFSAKSEVTISPITNQIGEYRWTVICDGNIEEEYTSVGKKGEFKYIFTKNEKDYQLKVVAIDLLGNEQEKTVNIRTGYLNPSVSIVEVNNKVINGGSVNINSEFGTSLEFSPYANSNNQNGRITKYAWYVNEQLKLETSNPNSFKYTFGTGNNKVKLKVKDSYNKESEVEFNFIVNNYLPPKITQLYEDKIGIKNGAKLIYKEGGISLRFIVDAELPYEFTTITKYEWYLNGVKQKSSLYNYYNANLGIGKYSVQVNVYDNKGNFSTKRMDFEIANVEKPNITTNPQASNETIIALEPGVNTFKLKAKSNLDEFFNMQNVKYKWKINGAVYITNNANDWISYPINNSVRELVVEVYAEASNGIKSPVTNRKYMFKQKVIDELLTTYKDNGDFDIIGKDNDIEVQTTYRNNGYSTTYWVDNIMYEQNSNNEEYAGVKFTREIVYDGYDIIITHKAKNNSSSDKQINISLDSDIMIYGNDRATVQSDGNSIYMTHSKYTFYFKLKGSPQVTDVSTFWYGGFNARKSNRLNQKEPLDNLINVDSGMAFSWKNQILKPGEEKSYTVIMGLV